jgi:hypothetical protein
VNIENEKKITKNLLAEKAKHKEHISVQKKLINNLRDQKCAYKSQYEEGL